MSSDWEKAEEIEWEGYYRAVEGRALREVFVDALPLLPIASPDERPLVAVDLGWKGSEPFFPHICRRVLNRDYSI